MDNSPSPHKSYAIYVLLPLIGFLASCTNEETVVNTDMPPFRFSQEPIPNAPGWERVQPNARGIQQAYVRRQLIRLFNGEYALLEDEARNPRLPLPTIAIGLSDEQLWGETFLYYQWNDHPSWDGFFVAIDEWENSFPKSPKPHLARAAGLISYAWYARGTGPANTVTPENYALFQDRLEAADRSLRRSVELGGAENSFTPVLKLRVARGLGIPKEEVKEMTDRFLQQYPESPAIYAEWIRYLSPRWYGEVGEWQDWLVTESDNERWGPDGMSAELYARILWSAFYHLGNNDGLFFQAPQLDWEKTAEGLLECIRWDAPETPYWKSVLVSMATATGDRQITKEAIGHLSGLVDTWVINSNRWARIVNNLQL